MAIIEPLKKEKRDIVLTIRVTKSEKDSIMENSEKFADGNYSDWMRYAAISLKPRKKLMQEFQSEGDCHGSNSED